MIGSLLGSEPSEGSSSGGREKMRATVWTSLLVVAGFMWNLLAFAIQSKAHDEKNAHVSLDLIHHVWKSRQASVRSLKFDWVDQQYVTKGSISRLAEIALRKKSEQSIPSDDMVQEVKTFLSIDGDKMRYSFDGPMWSESKQRFVPQQYISTYDGKTSSYYWPPGVREGNGAILARKYNKDVSTFHVMPLLINYRLFNTSMTNHRLQEVIPTEEKGVVGDRLCLVMKEKSRLDRKSLYLLWIDPERDFIVRRLEFLRNDELALRMDIDYSRDAQYGWVPNSWQTMRPSKEASMFESYKCTVTAYEFNSTLDPEDFEISFPPGARVYDENSDREYIVTEGGGQRLITDAEARLTYEQLVGKKSKWITLTYINIIILTLVIIFIAIKRTWKRWFKRDQL